MSIARRIEPFTRPLDIKTDWNEMKRSIINQNQPTARSILLAAFRPAATERKPTPKVFNALSASKTKEMLLNYGKSSSKLDDMFDRYKARGSSRQGFSESKNAVTARQQLAETQRPRLARPSSAQLFRGPAKIEGLTTQQVLRSSVKIDVLKPQQTARVPQAKTSVQIDGL